MTARLRALLLAAAVAGSAPASVVLAHGGNTAPASPAASPEPPVTVVLTHGQRVYKGTGNTNLGGLKLGRTARLSWRHPSGGRLRLLTSGGGGAQVPVLTTAFRSGSVALRAGTYRGLLLQTRGGWRITVTTLRHGRPSTKGST
jgi:hypothetical protein